MDLNVIRDLIANLGFPIAVVMAMAWYIVKRQETHDSQVMAFVDALNKNTVAIAQLTEKIKGE